MFLRRPFLLFEKITRILQQIRSTIFISISFLKAIKDALAPVINNAKFGMGGALLSEPTSDDMKDEEPEWTTKGMI